MNKHEMFEKIMEWVKEQDHLEEIILPKSRKNTKTFKLQCEGIPTHVMIKITPNAITQGHSSWSGFQSRAGTTMMSAQKYLSIKYLIAAEQRCGGHDHCKRIQRYVKLNEIN